MRYNVVHDDGKPSSVTIFDGTPGGVMATADHPNFNRILNALDSGDSKVMDLFNIEKHLSDSFAQLSERIAVRNGAIYFDGDPVDNGLTDAILRYYNEGDDNYKPLVNFMEKISNNPQLDSRVSLFRWLGKHRFAIAEDGDFIAYKGVRKTKDSFESVNSGRAMVNGKQHKGLIPNAPGTVVEMPRSSVTFDSKIGCSQGLHAGNWSYASNFGDQGVTLRVKINPRDVVSVPHDCNDEKLRVCRYHVVDQVKSEDTSMLFAGDVPTRRARTRPTKKGGVVGPDKVFEQTYESFRKKDFVKLGYNELRWLAKNWEVKGIGSHPLKASLVDALSKEAAKRRRRKK